MSIEIERKFLVDKNLWQQLNKPQGIPFLQGYILDDETRIVRVRATNAKGYITLKGASEGFSRIEYEYEIPVREANELIENFAQSTVQKTRYCIEFAEKIWEVDDFEEDNTGLLMAEIELDSEDETFHMPPWVGEEVTHDARYYNSYLSQHPFTKWDHDIITK